jgi:hypothetical protein
MRLTIRIPASKAAGGRSQTLSSVAFSKKTVKGPAVPGRKSSRKITRLITIPAAAGDGRPVKFRWAASRSSFSTLKRARRITAQRA